MTREEAIERLNNAKSCPLLYKSHVEALDMAIKALLQEPCDDAISREAVIDTLQYAWEANKDIQESIVEIKALPSVTPSRHVNCEIAEHDSNGCLGYSHYGDDFPIKECLHCPKYTSYE